MEAAFVLILLLCIASSAENSMIPVLSELRAGTNSSVWLSPSGIFAFGFYATSKSYAVCIFLAGVLNRTVVWTAKENNPVLPNDVDHLLILEDKIRLLRNSQCGNVSYYAFASTLEAISGASMLDNGNFVLYNSEGRAIWQSFDHPTDTLLPGQRLLPAQRLVSRASRTDLAKGVFRLKMKTDGNLVQYPVGTPDDDRYAYYSFSTHRLGGNFSLNLENDGRLYLYNGTVSYDITCGGGGSVVEGSIYMARVDSDGIFRLYSRRLDGGDNSTVRWSSTEDRCTPKGICGENSVCTYEGGVVACTCLPGFGDGCRGEFDARDCQQKGKSTGYEMKTVRNVTWVENYYAVEDAFNEQGCGAACLDDCNCFVASFKDGKCRKQTSPMEYGRKSSVDSSVALVRVSVFSPAPAPQEAPNGSGFGKGLSRHRKGISYLHKYVIIGVSTALATSSIIIYYLTRKRGFCSHDEADKESVNMVLNHGSLAPRRYSHKEIKKMTKSFTEKLGQGGYGVVYKGKLPDGKLVAVKVLTKTHDKGDDFLNEVASISRTSHVNIVNLLGFCLERKKRALVYEFMPNKSLDKFIYKRGSLNVECSLEWNKVYEIAVGVARGLEYLHRGCNTRIVHFDIKPQNILLDGDFCPKISDFGLGKLCKTKQSVISMLGTRGTIGYIAPEVFSRNFGLVSHKSDVYSYGIMLLQMVEARTNFEAKSFLLSDEDYFLEEIYERVLVQNEKVYAVVTEEEEGVVRKMLKVGFWCIQTALSDRPSMNKVVDMLEGNEESIGIVPLPFLLSSPKLEFSGLQLPVTVETQSSNRS